MRCADFEKRLHRLLDQREIPSEDSQLNRHAHRCPECRETLAACGRMIDGLNLMELPVPGDDFPLRVVRQTQIGRPSLAASRRFNAAWAAIAVTLALALLLPFACAKTARSRLPPPARRLRGSMAPTTPARSRSKGTTVTRTRRKKLPSHPRSTSISNSRSSCCAAGQRPGPAAGTPSMVCRKA